MSTEQISIETLRRIAKKAYPNILRADNFCNTSVIMYYKKGNSDYVYEDEFNPHTNPEQELHLIRMYREFIKKLIQKESLDLDAEAAYRGYSILFHALESTETLLKAIEREML